MQSPHRPGAGMPNFGPWKYTADRDSTILAYRRTACGGADTCNCAGCRNFRLARAASLPTEFLALLDTLGIDSRKDAEVYHNARLAPGRHDYGGWYHFVGTLDQSEDSPPVDLGGGFSAWMCHASAPSLPSLEGMKVVQVNFHAEAVPWWLNEPEIM